MGRTKRISFISRRTSKCNIKIFLGKLKTKNIIGISIRPYNSMGKFNHISPNRNKLINPSKKASSFENISLVLKNP
jgi:hypothetical protein